GNPPVAAEEIRGPLGRHQLEPVAPVEADRPLSRRPRSDQNLTRAPTHQVLEQRAADTESLPGRSHVRVADQLDVLHRLDAHYPGQLAVDLAPPERDPGGDRFVELAQREVRLVPTIG